MIVLLSPAKTLNFEDELDCPILTKPIFSKEASELATELKKLSAKKIQSLMSISPKLAALNVQRYKEYSSKPKPSAQRQALLAYRGDVYQGFSLSEYKKRDYEFAQKSIRILSGLYGYLRPADTIQPYRLEMKTKLQNAMGKDLYTYWNNQITQKINKELKQHKFDAVINLASVEYSKSVQFENVEAKVIHVDFKVQKGDELKTVGIFAKKARGSMANFIVQKRITKPNDLKKFKGDGWKHSNALSSAERMLFTR